MSSDPNQPVNPPSPQPLPGAPIAPPTVVKKKSGCVGCLLGCLVVIVLGVLAIGGLGYLGLHKIMKKTEGAVSEFKTKGFLEEKSEFISTSASIQGKKLLHGSYMTIVTNEVDSELAVVGVVAMIDSNVHGNLYFRGGVLVIGENAAIYGDVDVDCYNVIVEGYVQGQVKGNYQRLDETQRRRTPPASFPVPIADPPPEKEPTPPAEPPPPPPTAEIPAAPPTETPAPPPEPPTPPSDLQPNPPDEQPPADSPAPPPAPDGGEARPDGRPDNPPAEPTPTDPKPIEPVPSPPDPAPPSA